MALSFRLSAKPAVSIAEFVDGMRPYDLSSPSGVAEAVDLFAALNANKTLLVDHVTAKLKDLRENDLENEYTGQTFMIHRAKGYFVRANIWLPKAYPLMAAASASDQFFYELPHDHNFTFMTAGYHGSGYRTKIFEYDGIGRSYNVGDEVETTFLEDAQLDYGKIMIFRASRDIHIQYPPGDFSVSLNLMTQNLNEQIRTQQIFDDSVSRISSQPNGREKQYDDLFGIASLIGDGNTRDIVESLSLSSDEALRASASRCIERMTTMSAS